MVIHLRFWYNVPFHRFFTPFHLHFCFGYMQKCSSSRTIKSVMSKRKIQTPYLLSCVLTIRICVVSVPAAAKSLQLCPTLCDPRDSSPPGAPVSGILQARTLEWVAISFSNAWKWKAKGKSLSRIQLLATPWTAAYQAPSFIGFSRQEYWSGVPLPSPDSAT